MGLISRVSSRTYSKTGELGEEHLVYTTQSAKARKHNTPSKSPTSPSCYHFQKSYSPPKKPYNFFHSSTNSPIRYKTKSLRKHHSLSKIKLSYEREEERESFESKQQRNSSSQNYVKVFPCQILLNKLLLKPNLSTTSRNTNNQAIMSAAKVRVHNTSTSSIDAVVEPLVNFQQIKVDTSKLRVWVSQNKMSHLFLY